MAQEGPGKQLPRPRSRRRRSRSGQGVVQVNRKTEICQHWQAGSCPYGASSCAFAHGLGELRHPTLDDEAIAESVSEDNGSCPSSGDDSPTDRFLFGRRRERRLPTFVGLSNGTSPARSGGSSWSAFSPEALHVPGNMTSTAAPASSASSEISASTHDDWRHRRHSSASSTGATSWSPVSWSSTPRQQAGMHTRQQEGHLRYGMVAFSPSGNEYSHTTSTSSASTPLAPPYEGFTPAYREGRHQGHSFASSTEASSWPSESWSPIPQEQMVMGTQQRGRGDEGRGAQEGAPAEGLISHQVPFPHPNDRSRRT